MREGPVLAGRIGRAGRSGARTMGVVQGAGFAGMVGGRRARDRPGARHLVQEATVYTMLRIFVDYSTGYAWLGSGSVRCLNLMYRAFFGLVALGGKASRDPTDK